MLSYSLKTSLLCGSEREALRPLCCLPYYVTRSCNNALNDIALWSCSHKSQMTNNQHQRAKIPANTNLLLPTLPVHSPPHCTKQTNNTESHNNKKKSLPKMTYGYICLYCFPVLCCVLLYEGCSGDTCTIIIYFHAVPPVAQQPPHHSYFPTELEFISLRSDKHSHRSIPHSCRNHHSLIKRIPDSYHCQLLSLSFPR